MNEIQLLKQQGLYEEFKTWVEDTKLFGALVEKTNRERIPGLAEEYSIIVATNPDLRIELNHGVVINKMEDLPIEVLKEFYINSPFYKGFNATTSTDGLPHSDAHSPDSRELK